MHRNTFLWSIAFSSFIFFLLFSLETFLPPIVASPLVYGSIVILSLAVWALLISPTFFLFGERHLTFDIPIIVAVFGCALSGILTILDISAPLYEGAGPLFGILLLLGVSIGMSASVIVKRESLLFSLGVGGTSSIPRIILTTLLLCAFSILFVRPILLLLADMPRWVLSLIFFSTAFFSLAATGFLGKYLAGVSFSLHRNVMGFRAFFFKRSTILLGLSIFLLGPFVIDTLFWSLPKSLSLLGEATLAGQWLLSLLYSLAIFGSLFLSVLPLWIWIVLCRLRKTADDQHLPSWNAFTIALSYAVILAAFMVPGVGVQEWIISSGYLDQFSPSLVLLSAGSIFLFVLLIASISELLRRILLGGPFLFSIIFLGAYVYARFVTVFAELMMTFSFPQALPLATASMIFLLSISLLFSILGYFGFLYEIWRD